MTRLLTDEYVAGYRNAAKGEDYVEVWAPDLRAFIEAYDLLTGRIVVAGGGAGVGGTPASGEGGNTPLPPTSGGMSGDTTSRSAT